LAVLAGCGIIMSRIEGPADLLQESAELPPREEQLINLRADVTHPRSGAFVAARWQTPLGRSAEKGAECRRHQEAMGGGDESKSGGAHRSTEYRVGAESSSQCC